MDDDWDRLLVFNDYVMARAIRAAWDDTQDCVDSFLERLLVPVLWLTLGAYTNGRRVAYYENRKWIIR